MTSAGSYPDPQDPKVRSFDHFDVSYPIFWVVIKSCIEILTSSSHFQELSSQKSISDSDYRPLSNKPQDIDSETYTNNMGMGWKVHCNLTIQ